jgi:rod shape determining protein RodA
MSIFKELNWPVVFIWIALTAFGLVSIYSATQGPVSDFLPSYIQENFSRQLLWVAISIVIMAAVQFISPRTFQGISYFLYGFTTILMLFTVFFGVEVSGSRSWLNLGFVNIQVGELMKLATILAVANYLTSRRDITAENLKTAFVALLFFTLPVILLILQNEAGIAVIFIALLPFMLFWSGLPHGITLLMISPAIIAYFTVIDWRFGIVAAVIITFGIFFIQRRNWLTASSLVVGLMTVIGTEVALHQVLQPHQTARIEAFVNPALDPQGTGWNILQATTAIGSGGLTGKGFMEGTQTQLRFLPEQWTDFIFCVVGEEFGFIGTGTIMILFLLLFLFLINMASTHKHPFAQLVIVSAAAVFFIHFSINIASATAIMPVIGLPLPFVSYGGSAFLTNSLLLAICLNFDFYKRSFSIYS